MKLLRSRSFQFIHKASRMLAPPNRTEKASEKMRDVCKICDVYFTAVRGRVPDAPLSSIPLKDRWEVCWGLRGCGLLKWDVSSNGLLCLRRHLRRTQALRINIYPCEFLIALLRRQQQWRISFLFFRHVFFLDFQMPSYCWSNQSLQQ